MGTSFRNVRHKWCYMMSVIKQAILFGGTRWSEALLCLSAKRDHDESSDSSQESYPSAALPIRSWGVSMVAMSERVSPATSRVILVAQSIEAAVDGSTGWQAGVYKAIRVFTSQDDQFWTNSVMIEGVHEVMLVDAQLTKTNAERVLQEIKETHKPLSLIYITHEHADHFLGLEVFREAYPRVRIIATSAVVARIHKVYQEKIDKWKQLLGSGATTHVVPIEPFDGNTITFESSHIEVLKHIKATPMKTRCCGFLDREFSLVAMSCSTTCTCTPQKRTVRLEEMVELIKYNQSIAAVGCYPWT